MSVFTRTIFYNSELRNGLLKAWLNANAEVKIYFRHGEDLRLALTALRKMHEESELIFTEEKEETFYMVNGS